MKSKAGQPSFSQVRLPGNAQMQAAVMQHPKFCGFVVVVVFILF